MDKDKKIAAAIAALDRYIEMEALERSRPALRKGTIWDRQGGLTFRRNIWGVSGRQDQMQVRTLMQLRTFNKFRFPPKGSKKTNTRPLEPFSGLIGKRVWISSTVNTRLIRIV